jgi:transcriptional regulator with XRE-family HTH domain
MGKKTNPPGKDRREYTKTYLHEWLVFRNKTHEQLANALELSRPQVTKIVNGKRPYTQAFLEAAAEYLDTDPASLLMRDPTQPEAIWSIWDHASEGEKNEIRRFAEFTVKEKKAG